MKAKLVVTGVVAFLSIVAVATMPASIGVTPSAPALPLALDQYLADSEHKVDETSGIIPETEKRILWHDPATHAKTPLALVYFHGFSATRQEIAPVGANIAEALSANLFETRFAGHGLRNNALENVVAEDWLADAAEALAVGAAIGDRVVLFGTSTGATLALAMMNDALTDKVDTVILMSPNLALQDRTSEILTWPGGPLLARMLIGTSRSWTPANESQALYWTTTYPLPAVVEMMRLVKHTRNGLPHKATQRILTVASPNDQVVNPVRSYAFVEKIDAPENRFVFYDGSSDHGQHVLAGDILSPQSNQAITDLIVEFVRDGKKSLAKE